MVDLARFDDEKRDPGFPVELDPQIISALFDHPEALEEHLPHLNPINFRSPESQYVVAEILEYYQKYGAQPTREILWDIVSRQLDTDGPYAEIKTLIFRETIGREYCYIRDILHDWLKQRTLARLYDEDTAEAIERGDLDIIRRIADEADAIGLDNQTNGVLTPSELFAPNEEEEWSVDGILAPSQPCIVGGPSKSMKTSLLCDLAVSIASGKPFLGEYPSRQSRVLFISGESGRIALKNTLRAIMRRRHIAENTIEEHLLISFNLPLLSTDTGLAGLRKTLQEHKPAAVILDPLYLCLLSSDDAGAASNIFAMGTRLGRLSRLFQELEATAILCHHFNRKGVAGSWPSLADLSQAGAAEFCRQWILLRRAKEYRGDGYHELNVSIGGEGRCQDFRLTVNEGREDRDWEVVLTPREELEEEEQAGRRDKQAEKVKEEQEELVRGIRSLARTEERATRYKLKQFIGWSGTRLARVLERALELHLVVEQEEEQREGDKRRSKVWYETLEEQD
ncbi:MAG: AAA family ATPase [Planctomycetota bacterium]|jgi:hypothetical protein